MSNAKYALNIGEIENAVMDFATERTSVKIVLHKKESDQFIYKIFKNDNDAVTLTFYITKGGQVSHYVHASPRLSDLKSIAEQCWEYVVDKTHISCISFNFFKFNDVKDDEFEAFSSIMTDNYSYEANDFEIRNENIKYRKCYTDQYGAQVYANYYKNGTLTLQGSLTPMFTNVWTECVSLVGDIPTEEQEAFLSYSTSSPNYRYSENLNSYIKNLTPIKGTKIELLTRVSIKLANLGIVCDDNAWITFSALKGLDALLSLKLTEGNPVNSFDQYSVFFEPVSTGSDNYVFRSSIIAYDGNTPLKSSLERGYSLLRKYRNTTFHIDRANIESSVILTYERATDVLEKVLKVMDEICKNW